MVSLADTGREAGRSGTSVLLSERATDAVLRAGPTSVPKVGPPGDRRRVLHHSALYSAFTARLRHADLEPVFLLRSLCWLRRRHRWRVPTQALQTEYRHQTFRIRCRDCGAERRMTGLEIQYRRVSGNWEREL